MNVQINAPTDQPPIEMPALPTGVLQGLVVGEVVAAMWYQVDGGDAVSFDTFATDGSGWTFTLDGVAVGQHVLSVSARTNDGNGNPLNVNTADQNFGVTQGSMPPPG